MTKSVRPQTIIAGGLTALLLGIALPVFPSLATSTPIENTHRPTTGPAASLRIDNPAGLSTGLHTNASGLLGSQTDGAFPPELWTTQSPALIRDLLTQLVPNPEWPNNLMIARRLLLSDVEWPDETLTPLRIARMIDFGAGPEAAKLYGHQAPDTPSLDLLHVGLRALLIAGQPSVACLEFKANRKITQSDKDPYWTKIGAFCDGLIAREDHGENQNNKTDEAPTEQSVPAPIPDRQKTIHDLATATSPVLFPQTLDDFFKLDPFITESHRVLPGLSLAKLTSWDLPSDIPTGIAATLAQRTDIPLGLKLKLFVVSSDTTPPAAHEDDPTTYAEKGMWADMANLYRAQTGGITASHRLEFSRKVLALAKDAPLRPLTLFADTLSKLPVSDDLTREELRYLLMILLAVDSDAAGPWLAQLGTNLGNNPQHSVIDSALFLLGQTRGYVLENHKFPLSFSQLSKENKPRLQKIFKILSELLDTPPTFIDNPPSVYEKKADLTTANHYVMPMQVLRNHLTDGKEKMQLGRVVLAGLLTLQTVAPDQIDPDALDRVLNGLIGIGLGEEARQIATTVLLGVIYTGEK